MDEVNNLLPCEDELQALFSMTGLGVAQTDPFTRRMLRVNTAFCALSGYSERELLSMTVDQLNHPDDRERDVEALQKFLRGEALDYQVEKRYRRKDGTVVWVGVNGNVVRDNRGKVLRLIAVVQDVSARKHSEMISQRYQLLSKHSRDIMLFFAIDGKIMEANEAAVRAYGYGKDELLAKSLYDIRAAETRGEIPEQLRLVQKGPLTFETIHQRKDGTTFPVEVSWSCAPMDHCAMVLSIIRDVTERKRTEAELQESRARERAFLEHLPVGVWFLNAQGEIVFGNRMGQKIWAGAEFVGVPEFHKYKGWVHGTGEQLAAEQWAGARAIVKGETTIEEAIDIECFDGTRKTILNSAVPVRGIDEAIIGAVVINQDITRRIQAQQELRISESRFRMLVDELPFSLQIMDPTGRLVRVNSAWEKMWGVTLDQLSDYSILEDEQLKEKGIMPYLRQAFEGVAAEIPAVAYVPRRGQFEGQTRWSRSIVYPVRNEDGKLREVVMIQQDITERKLADEELRATAERLSLALSAAELGDWSWDAKTDVVNLSEQAAQIFGIKGSHITWTEMQKLLHTDDRERVARQVTEAVAGRHRYESTYRVVRGDGSQVWVSAFGLTQYGADHNPTKMLGVVVDITGRKTTELALANARAELEQHAAGLERSVAERTARLRDTIAELEHFSYTITHDMRAPLRAMQAFGDILREEYQTQLDETGRDYLRRIVEAANRMDCLITDSLNYSKTVQTELTLERIDSGELVWGIVESYPQFQPPRAQIEIMGSLPAVMANKAGLTQCFSNIVGNAVKFVKPGTIPRVRIWGERKGDVVRFWVEDNGIGIPTNQSERVFSMFQRLNNHYEGTGVGLALVLKVVEKMRGKVGFESEPGQGTRFWLELAAAKGQHASDRAL